MKPLINITPTEPIHGENLGSLTKIKNRLKGVDETGSVETPEVSVIIPVRNEELNLEILLLRISDTLKKSEKSFEIIAVDDYSTDQSHEILKKLARQYPLHVHKKKGVIGKGNSLLEGIEKSKGDIIVLIDADLAHPPEYILPMLKELKQHDIVLGDRIYVNGERVIKKMFAKASNFLFGRVFFGLKYDVQSGLKVFKREILDYIELNPSKWSFDFEFLLKATNAGYRVDAYPIDYVSRKKGRDQMNLFQCFFELSLMTIRYWLSPFEPTVFYADKGSERVIGWKKGRYKPYTSLHLKDSAIKTITRKQLAIIIGLIAATLVLFIYNWLFALMFFVSFISVIYFTDLLFNLYIILSSLRKPPEINISKKDVESEYNWPVYTVICPLYKEWMVVPQFITAMERMDYPKDKLQVIIVLEEDDAKTIEMVKMNKLPSFVEVLVTPHHQPKTKPKACNYALLKAKGKYVVIYDAEDMPEPTQLKKAVIAFEKYSDKNIVCLQAKLNFYNVHQNLLTRLFTLEYSLWFDLVLTGLHSIGAPIPLGGTSNHFKRDSLRLLQGWDPFNVTEDCDLGIRLFKNGYKTQVLNSITLEEANSSFFGWFKQRSRWIKGYIQTYLVHMRRPHEFITDWNNPHLLTFQLIVGGKVLSMWINPFLWLTTIAYFVFRPIIGVYIEALYLTPIFYLAVISLVFGNFLYFYYYMIGAAKREQWDLIKVAFVVPFYWLMMSISSWMALYEIIWKPHYWQKTKHGLHLNKTKVALS